MTTFVRSELTYRDLPFEERLGHLPGFILLSLARNDAASREERKAAVEFMIEKGFPEADHPDLGTIAHEIRQEREARQIVEAVVESALESEIPDHSPKASFTTASIMQTEICQNKSSSTLPDTGLPS